MARFIIIDNRTGYIILDTADVGGTNFDTNDPLVACRLYDPEQHYYIVSSLSPRAVGYRVYLAEDGIPVIREPHHAHLIELIETECPLVANIGIVS
jgi:hypothetical protein